MAMCVMAVVGVAPCQCLSFGGHQTTSPGRISTFGPPSLCTHPRVPMSVPREPVQLLKASRVAEDHLVSGTREDRSELAAHQPRTQNADSHITRPRRSAAGRALQVFGVSSAVDCDLRGGLLD